MNNKQLINSLYRSIYLVLFLLISISIGYGQKKVIAVAPFEVPGNLKYNQDINSSGLAEKIPVLMEDALFSLGLFEIVERARLDVLFDEQTYSYSGLTNKEYDFGAWEGVDYFVMGKISGFSADYDNVSVRVGTRNMYVNTQNVAMTLTVKLVDVNTSRIINVITEEATESVKGRPRGNPKYEVDKKHIDDAAKAVVKQIAERIKESTSISEQPKQEPEIKEREEVKVEPKFEENETVVDKPEATQNNKDEEKEIQVIPEEKKGEDQEIEVISEGENIVRLFMLESTPIVIEANTGDTVTIMFEAQFSTGKRWMPDENYDPSLQMIGESQTITEYNEAKVDIQVFEFYTESPGTYDLTFYYRRPFGQAKNDSEKKVILKIK